MLRYLIFLLIAAIVPAVALMVYIFKKDRLEKEPQNLLWKLLLFGAVFSFIPSVTEVIGELICRRLFSGNLFLYYVVFAFLVVGLSEEGTKYFVMKKRTWNNANFNCSFDGIVYASYVSLGFAAFENVLYVLGSGLSAALSTAFARAITAIPAHFFNAVFMGLFYGRAQECRLAGDSAGMRRNLKKALWIPVLLHGFYDACAFMNTGFSGTLLTMFLVVLYVAGFKIVKRESSRDRYLTGDFIY